MTYVGGGSGARLKAPLRRGGVGSGVWSVVVAALWFSSCLAAGVAAEPAQGNHVINVVLMGATGNLAQKYLWTSLHNILAKGLAGDSAARKTALTMWPAATKPASVSGPLMESIFAHNVTYASPASEAAFRKRVMPYTQLAEPAHFKGLADHIQSQLDKDTASEAGRLVYLSVPPKFFGDIAKSLKAHLLPQTPGAWFKVIVEKPFGVDLESAQKLASELFQHLNPDQVLLIDHYCGKAGVAGIRHFLELNPEYSQNLLTAKHVKSIDVQMVETEDVKGRTSFYDEVGVVRDTMQNHLMVMLQLVAMEVPSSANANAEEANRLQVVKSMPTEHRVERLAQYSEYNQHVREGGGKGDSKTPTYARVSMKIAGNHKLAGTRVVFTSGKALRARRAYVQVEFKSGETLTFMVQGELDVAGTKVSGGAIHASRGLPAFAKEPPQWTMSADKHTVTAPKDAPNAYEVLLRDALEGRFNSFVKIPEVLEAWRLWGPVLSTVESGAAVPVTLYGIGGVGLPDLVNGVEAGKHAKVEL